MRQGNEIEEDGRTKRMDGTGRRDREGESWNWGNVTGERVGSGDFAVSVCVPFLGDTAPHCKDP